MDGQKEKKKLLASENSSADMPGEKKNWLDEELTNLI